VKTMSVTRITGMATGMDTESIVKKLMDVERIPLNRLKQKQQTQMWLIDSYRQWNSDLFSFRNTELFNMKMSKTYNTFDVGSALPNSVTGTATTSAITGNYSLSIKQLAESATFTSSGLQLDTTKTLGDTAQGIRRLTADTSVTINVYNDSTNPTAFQTANIAVTTTDTISAVVSKINSATDASGKSLGLQAIYDPNLQQFLVKTKATGETTKIEFTNLSPELSNTLGIGTHASVTGSTTVTPATPVNINNGNKDLTINLGGGVSATINLTAVKYTSAQALADEINLQIGKNSSLANNVSASVDTTGKITLTSMAVGTQSSLTVMGGASTLIGFPATTSTGTMGTLSVSGKNADITFNGQQVTTLTSNNATLMGINLTLKSPTVDASGNPITTNITVSRNVDTAFNNIKDFVTKYNDMIDKITKVTTEAVYRDFLPLLDEQKSDMSEKQIEQWEAKAKSGLLRGDGIMTDLYNKMRNIMSSVVSTGSSYNSLASIGIASRNYQDKGKLYIDETKLKAALEKDPDAVQKLFSQVGDTATGTNGLVNRISDEMQGSIKKLTAKAGAMGNSQYDQSIIGRMLSRLQTDITRQNDRLAKKENLYYKQFAAMEEAVAKFNSQSSWLYQQSGGQY
jgi:flagellar hook-associated protein 2